MKRDVKMLDELELRKIACNAVISNATDLDGVLLGNIPIELLQTDETYQREIAGARWPKIIAIANGYNPAKANAILVSYRKHEGYFYIIDGQGRFEAAKKAGKVKMVSHILQDITVQEEAKYFKEQDDNTTKVSAYHKVRAGITARDKDCTNLQLVANKYGYDNLKEINAIGTALEIAETNPTELDWIFRTLSDAGWGHMEYGFSRTVIKALGRLYEKDYAVLSSIEVVLLPIMAENSPKAFKSATLLNGSPSKAEYVNMYEIMSNIGNSATISEAVAYMDRLNMKVPNEMRA